ncbi:MAG TPA: ATP-binding protein [Acidimicrobiales bacterium]|jgi:hypothetical protein
MAAKPKSNLAYLCRALKAPSLAASVERLSERARAENWSHEEFLAACLEREVASRQDHGGENRIRAARFPSRKTLEDFDFDHQRSLKRDTLAHLGTLDFVDRPRHAGVSGPAIASPLRPQPSGSVAWARAMPPAVCTTSSPGCAAPPWSQFSALARSTFVARLDMNSERSAEVVDDAQHDYVGKSDEWLAHARRVNLPQRVP